MFVRNTAATLTIAVFVFPMSEDLGWSRTLIVGAAAAAGVAAMLVSPLAGWVVQRFGARTLMSSSVILLGAVILSLRWTTSPVTFYLLFGIGRLMFAAPLQIGASTAAAAMRPMRCGLCGLPKVSLSGPPSHASIASRASGASGVVAW